MGVFEKTASCSQNISKQKQIGKVTEQIIHSTLIALFELMQNCIQVLSKC